MNSLTLWNIKEEFLALQHAIEEQDGEITPEQEQALAINETNFVEKAENTGKYILYLQAYQQAAQAEIERIEKLKAKAQEAIDRNKKRLAEAVGVYGKEQLKKVLGVSIGSSKTHAVVIYDEAQIPDEFFHKKVRETVTISKEEIKKALNEGREVAGAYLEEHINISVK